jgi:putative heme transporter
VIIVTLLFFAELAGVGGAIIAVPAVAAGQIILREVLAYRREQLNLPRQGPASEKPPLSTHQLAESEPG